ncbi:hypothetical protein DIURU_000705 [Diutina rugosa]|uniref:TECPR1-like DysF domain-containing protein n=1 Tax=Diutina rugosa TaxID=5481 RepID=A0A642UWZ4_DIURU|nr:uncharacterized protein DIURU_000705 [Diutina rugosa]KAA8907021.1 hypothetical protein DIURU_000705 [Diutina rugosa]
MYDIVEAPFVPTTAEILTESSNANLLTENPILASALSMIFPYIILIDNFLELCTWSNEDPFDNLLVVLVYGLVVRYWSVVTNVLLPFLFALTFSSVVWRANSVIADSRFNEKPTIDEVINTLSNITGRVEVLLRPIRHFPMGPRQLTRLLLGALAISPVHWLLLNTVISVKRYVWLLGTFALTYHSPWSYSIRRLIWRSVYVRVIAFYVTGISVTIDKKHQQRELSRSRNATTISTPVGSDMEDVDPSHIPVLSDFKIIRKIISSPVQLKQIVEFAILENERRWFGLGWSHFMMPGDRPNYCYDVSFKPAPPVDEDTNDNFPFPVFENDLYSYHWNWVAPEWTLDEDYNKGKDKDGWVYHDSNWENDTYVDGFGTYTRSRKWTRRAELLIDKQDVVLDGK